MQELLLKLMNDLQVLKGIQQEKEKPAAQSFTPYGNFSMIDDVEVEIKYALMDEQFQQEDIQELMSKLLEDVRNISKELSEYINCPSWNHPIFYDNDDDEYTNIYRKPKAITPDLPTVEPDNSLSMGDEHLDTILSVENLIPIPCEFEGISDDACDVPICENPFTFDALNDHSEILSDSNDDDTSSNNNDFEDIEYVSLEEVNDVDQEEKDRLITNIESLNDNPTIDYVLKSPSLVPISVMDSNSFFEKSDTYFSFLDNSLPEFETFSDYTEETRSGSTTTHTNYSLPEHDSFLFKFESFHFDPSFPRPSLEPPDVEISLIIQTDAPVKNIFDELNEDECFDPGGGEIDVSQNAKDDDSFTFVIQTFLLFLTYSADSPLLLSSKNVDTIFDPDIST
ncbi:hypothetical protein Tco_1342404 [Tanacetum coccineum]